MSKFISRIFGSFPSNSTKREPTVLSSPETTLQEIKVTALNDFLNPEYKGLIAEGVKHKEITLPTLLFVYVSDDAAFVTEITLNKKLDTDGLPELKIKSVTKDQGKLFNGDVFVSNEALLDFTDEELRVKIASGEIGHGTCFLAKAIVSDKAIFGRNCIVGEGAKVFGGVFGDNVVIGRGAWIGEEVEVATGVLIGCETSLNGKIKIGFHDNNETGVDPAFIIIGDSCALEDCIIRRGTIMGKHCLVDNNPNFAGLIPDGATVVADGKSFEVVPY